MCFLEADFWPGTTSGLPVTRAQSDRTRDTKTTATTEHPSTADFADLDRQRLDDVQTGQSRDRIDWDDEHAEHILANCRRAVPEDGALLLVEWALSEGNAPSAGKFTDVVMMLMTGGKERTVEEYSHLLGRAGFSLNHGSRVS
jgi:hypothetical protein